MFILLFILGIFSLIFGICPLFLTLRLKRYVLAALANHWSVYLPKVSLVLPCKGLDPGFSKNVEALIKQDYPDYEIIFVTATDDDPAYIYLKDLISQNHSNIPMKLITAGISSQRGQKINNMLCAIDSMRPDTEVYAFVDSDIRPENKFLGNLVSPLQVDSIGVTTGIRWYLPDKKNIGALLQSVWAAGAYPLLIDQRHNFAWGGANALKKETFEKADVAKLLSHSISDTFAITNGVKSIDLNVHFVPQCVVVSHESATLKEAIEWTNRQTIISRVYSPSFWWMVFITYSFGNTMLFGGLAIFLLTLFGSAQFIIPSLMMLSLIPLQIINAMLLITVVKTMLPQHEVAIKKLEKYFFLVVPLASILILFNSIFSLTTNKITWRGIVYRLVSPTQTDILSL